MINNQGVAKEKFKSKIGGQALISGIMMRGIDKVAMACRLSDGTVDLESWEIAGGKNAPWYKKAVFIRGVFNMIDSLVLGYKCLNKSADKQLSDEEEEPSKFELWLKNKFGEKCSSIIAVLATILGVALAIVMFMFIPWLIIKLTNIDDIISSNLVLSLIEGVIKILIFIIYLWLISKLKEIKETFEYHGGEHKSIACYESGMDLTVDNVKKFSRFHPRCGTSFLILVLIISILVFSVIPWSTGIMRLLIKLIFLPIVVGISYELIKLAGRYTNIVTKIISAPGLWLQRLTTREPDDAQIEVAITALKAVIPDDIEEDRW